MWWARGHETCEREDAPIEESRESKKKKGLKKNSHSWIAATKEQGSSGVACASYERTAGTASSPVSAAAAPPRCACVFARPSPRPQTAALGSVGSSVARSSGGTLQRAVSQPAGRRGARFTPYTGRLGAPRWRCWACSCNVGRCSIWLERGGRHDQDAAGHDQREGSNRPL